MPLNNQQDNQQDNTQDQISEEIDIDVLEEQSDVFDPSTLDEDSGIPASYANEAAYLDYMGGNLAQQPQADLPKWNIQNFSSVAEAQYERNLDRHNFMSNLNQNVRNADPYAGAREGTYNASFRGANFERYYGHKDSGLYQKLGFNPYRDNEALYNQNTSGYKEWQRANDHWGSIASAGFENYFNSYTGDGGNMYADYEAAEKMEKGMSIGMSSKHGFAPAVSNFLLNSGTTVGMLGAFGTEGAILMAAAAVAGAATAPEAGAGALPFLARIGYGLKNLRAGMKTMRHMNTVGQGAKNLYTNVKAMNNISNARKAWQYTKNIGTGTLKSLNPLQGTMNAAKILRNRKSVSQGLTAGIDGVKRSENLKNWITGFHAFGEFARDIRGFNMAHSESRLEAGLVGNEVAKRRYNEYYASLKPGENIDQDKIENIRNDVVKASMGTYWRNLAVVYTTNKIVMKGIISPYRSAGLSKTLFGRVGSHQIIKEGGQNVVKKVKQGLQAPFTKQFWKPKNLLGNAYRYTGRNWAEGAQELYQEGLSAGMNEYYGSAALSADAGAFTNTIRQGFKSMYSTQGLEIFLNGFAMGGLIGTGSAVSEMAFTQGSRITKSGRENYNTQQENAKKTEEMLTTMINDPLEYFKILDSNPIFQAQISKQMDEAQKEGDKKSWLDFQHSSEFKHLMSSIQSGTLPFFIKNLEGYNDFTDTELKEAFAKHFTQSEIENVDLRGKLNTIIEKAKKLDTKVNWYNENYENPADRDQYVINSPEWFKESWRYAAFEHYKLQSIFMGEAYDNILERKLKIFNAISGTKKPLKGASLTEFNALLDEPSLMTEIKTLEQEIAVAEDGPQDKEQRKLTSNRKKKLETLLEYKEAISHIDAVRKLISLLEKNEIKVEGKELNAEESNRIIKKEANKNIKEGFENIEKAYYKYLGVIENSYNDKAPKNLSAEVFEMIVDYHLMTGEAKNLQLANDILMSPQGLDKFMTEHSEYLEYLYNRREGDLAEAKRKFEEAIKTNETLNKLFLAGFYMDPVFYPALKQGLSIKIPFYYTNKPLKSDEAIVESDTDLQKIYDILREYYQSKGYKVENYPDYIKTKEELNAEEKTVTPTATAPVKTIEKDIPLVDREFEQLPEGLQKEIESIADRMIINSDEEKGWLEEQFVNKLGFIKSEMSKQKTAGSGDIYGAIMNHEKGSTEVKPIVPIDNSSIKEQIKKLQAIIDDENQAKILKDKAQIEIDRLKKALNEHNVVPGSFIEDEESGKQDIEIKTIEIKTPNLTDNEKENISEKPMFILKSSADSSTIPIETGDTGIFEIEINNNIKAVHITNEGHISFNDFKNDYRLALDQAIESFKFPTIKNDVYKHEITVNNKTYYVNSISLQEWFLKPDTKLTRYIIIEKIKSVSEVVPEDVKVYNYLDALGAKSLTKEKFLKLKAEITHPATGLAKYLNTDGPLFKKITELDKHFKNDNTASKETPVQKNKTMIYNGVSKILGKGPIQVTVLSTKGKMAVVQFDAIDGDGPKTTTVKLTSLSEMKAGEPVIVTPKEKIIIDESKNVNESVSDEEVNAMENDLKKSSKSLSELKAEMRNQNKEDNKNC